jgi:ribose 5-phosphate isomerase B
MGGRIVAFGLAEEILTLWLTTPFEGGRHVRRLEQIAAIEEEEDSRIRAHGSGKSSGVER